MNIYLNIDFDDNTVSVLEDICKVDVVWHCDVS